MNELRIFQDSISLLAQVSKRIDIKIFACKLSDILLLITSFLNYCLLYLCLFKLSPAVPLYPLITIRYLSAWSATLNVVYSAYLMLPSKSSRSTLNETSPAAVKRRRLSFPSQNSPCKSPKPFLQDDQSRQKSTEPFKRPSSNVRDHVTQDLHGISAIWIDSVHTARCDTISIKQSATFGSC